MSAHEELLWEDPTNELSFTTYSQRSDVFRCTAQWHKKNPDFLKTYCRFNKGLEGGAGWVISCKNREEFLALLGEGPLDTPPAINAEAAPPPSPLPSASAASPPRAKPKARPRARVRVQAPPPMDIPADEVSSKISAMKSLMASLLHDIQVDSQQVEFNVSDLLIIGTKSDAVSNMAENQRDRRLTLWLESEAGAMAVLEPK